MPINIVMLTCANKFALQAGIRPSRRFPQQSRKIGDNPCHRLAGCLQFALVKNHKKQTEMSSLELCSSLTKTEEDMHVRAFNCESAARSCWCSSGRERKSGILFRIPFAQSTTNAMSLTTNKCVVARSKTLSLLSLVLCRPNIQTIASLSTRTETVRPRNVALPCGRISIETAHASDHCMSPEVRMCL